MSSQRISIRVFGEGLSPEKVSIPDLIEILGHVQGFIRTYTAAEGIDVGDEVLASLVGIRPGSEYLDFAIHPRGVPAVVAVAGAIAEVDLTPLPPATRGHVTDLNKWSAKRNWDIEILAAPEVGIPQAWLRHDSPFTIPSVQPIKGTTTLIGRCMRIGGVDPKIDIRPVDGGRLLHLTATEAQAQQLASRLYDVVALEVEAAWDRETMDPLESEYRVTRVLPYSGTDPVIAFDRLASLANGCWDDVDASDYVRKVREGQDP